MNEIFQPLENKLDGIIKQIYDLEASISNFTKLNVIKINRVFNEGNLGFKIIQESLPDNIPFNYWSMQFNGCIHNLRASLDNFAYALARLKRDPPLKENQIQFPIYTNRDEFFRKGKRNIEQLPDNACQLIENLQPFNRADNVRFRDPLVVINKLDIADKHRIPPITLITPKKISHKMMVEFEPECDVIIDAPSETNSFIWIGPLRVGQVLYEYKTINPIKSVHGNCEIEAEVGIQYKNEYLCIIPLLKDLYDYIVKIITLFDSII